ncbi:MAG: bifunctional proline dehydrogenase/L-glutamate gamma-semialdehyde dehydrogenase PutA [Rhodothalassiaceae bacterium]
MSRTIPVPAPDPALDEARRRLRAATYAGEAPAATALLDAVPLDAATRARARETAQAIVRRSRARRAEQGTLDAFLHEFGLSNQEGVALMCLAEALLRIPDAKTQDALIAEKIRTGDWASHRGRSDSPFVNAGVWALMLTGRVVKLDREIRHDPARFREDLVKRVGEPVIRKAVNQAMRIMGRQFVFGRTISEALARRSKLPPSERLFSFDMLGEGARTSAAAERYFALYRTAIDAVGGAERDPDAPPEARSSVSIKLSALHPRYEAVKWARLEAEMLPRLEALCLKAREFGMQLTIDAEEADRLDVSLMLFERLARMPSLAAWDGLGLAVQAYQKRAPHVIDWLAALARETGRRIPVRLVKGAYWDSEIKQAQMLGMPDYPVWTRKATTDLCYLVCAGKLFAAGEAFYPQFASHNAHTIAAVAAMGKGAAYEFQRLHGMGDILYKAVAETLETMPPLRTYAPVGAHRDLLPYLVRRLLENGANSSFVNRFMDESVAVAEVARDPVDEVAADPEARHPAIVAPPALYGATRKNSAGLNLADTVQREALLAEISEERERLFDGPTLVSGTPAGGERVAITSPADRGLTVGHTTLAGPEEREAALAAAHAAFPAWNHRGGAARAEILRAMADALEAHRATLVALMAREAGKTLADGIAEVREAVDFCRYYAAEAEAKFAAPVRLPGPTGESNALYLEGRGVFLSISPWNFPLAIFTGQLAAALAAGNTVIAKPAEQTPLVASYAVRLFHEAGVPPDALHLLAGTGPGVAAPLVADERIAGVAFTGSTETARIINRSLAAREGAIPVLIAETGGQNAMVVDSTALAEQVTDDVMISAFNAAGQRCSALRILCLQEEIADEMLDMITGALAERQVGDPLDPATDIGPIIDEEARAGLLAHIERMTKEARPLARGTLEPELDRGVFLAPHIFEIDSIAALEREVFGPVLHVLRYKAEALDALMSDLAATGYGLTFGVHSRLESRWNALFETSLAGNVYVNRNMIGAVVGVQPFGGRGLSGTGPKAGGPHYLPRFASERVKTVNAAAIGGNTELFRLGG